MFEVKSEVSLNDIWSNETSSHNFVTMKTEHRKRRRRIGWTLQFGHFKFFFQLILTFTFFLICLINGATAAECTVNIGDLIVVENPVRAPKISNSKLTSLEIREEQYFGSLTCHVLRDRDKPVFNHFEANSSGGTVFSSADTYDPYNFGKRTKRVYHCDVYLLNNDFQENEVDLEVALILQPLLRRNGKNVCDVPVIARQVVRIEFNGFSPTTSKSDSAESSTFVEQNFTPTKSTTVKRRGWWVRFSTTSSPFSTFSTVSTADKSTPLGLSGIPTEDSNIAKKTKLDNESPDPVDTSVANVENSGDKTAIKDDINPGLSNPNQNNTSSSTAPVNVQILTSASTTVGFPKFEDENDRVGIVSNFTTTISKSVDVFDKDDSDPDSLETNPVTTTAAVATTTTRTPTTTASKTETTLKTTTITEAEITLATTSTTITASEITPETTKISTTTLEQDSSSKFNPLQSGLLIPGPTISSLDSPMSAAPATSTTVITTTTSLTTSDDAFFEQDSEPTTTTRKKKKRPSTTTTTTVSTASEDYEIDSTSESTTSTTATTTRKKQRRRTTTTATTTTRTTTAITSSDGAYYDIDPLETTSTTTRPPKFVPEFGATASGNGADDSNEKRGVVELKPAPQGELGSVSNYDNRNPNPENRYPGDKNHRFVNNMNFDVSGNPNKNILNEDGTGLNKITNQNLPINGVQSGLNSDASPNDGSIKKNVTVNIAGPGIVSDDPKENTTLFWAILGIILVLAVALLIALIYYCCPNIICFCCGNRYALHKEVGAVNSAKDLTFVSVRDRDGRPLRDASSVEVWNTNKNNIKAYPVIQRDRRKASEGYHQFRNGDILHGDEDQLEADEDKRRRRLKRESEDYRYAAAAAVANGHKVGASDRMILVREGSDSPVMVRILRAMTPKYLNSRFGSGRSSQRRSSKMFDMSHGDLKERRSGSDRSDVQILSLDDKSRSETFRREGDAEILEIDQPTGAENDVEVTSLNDDTETHSASTSTSSLSTEKRQRRKNGLDVLPEEDDDNNNNEDSTPMHRKMSENKLLQTDISYGKANKRIQVASGDEIGNSDIDDDDDDDISDSTSGPNSMLSQSLRSNNTIHQAGVNQERYFRYKDQEPGTVALPYGTGFLNMAMHHLVQDEFQAKHKQKGRDRPSSVGEVERLNRRDENNGKFSFRRQRRSEGVLSYRDNNRTPSPTYTETKASILRRRKNVKPEPVQTGFNRSRKSTLNRQISTSLSDLRDRESVNLRPDDLNDGKLGELLRQNSTPSNLGI